MRASWLACAFRRFASLFFRGQHLRVVLLRLGARAEALRERNCARCDERQEPMLRNWATLARCYGDILRLWSTCRNKKCKRSRRCLDHTGNRWNVRYPRDGPVRERFRARIQLNQVDGRRSFQYQPRCAVSVQPPLHPAGGSVPEFRGGSKLYSG